MSIGNERLSYELLAAKKTALRTFCGQYYEMKATAGPSCTGM